MTAAQKTNLLTMVVASSSYPDLILTAEKFKLFRKATNSGRSWPQSGWGRNALKVLKATEWIPDKLEDRSVILKRFEGFVPRLKTSSWRIVRHERPQEENCWRI